MTCRPGQRKSAAGEGNVFRIPVDYHPKTLTARFTISDAIDASRKPLTLARPALSIHASVQGGALLTRVNRRLG
jgi:hypothetical protein